MRVYCLGDSMTYGFGVSRREAWPALVGAATGHEMINGGGQRRRHVGHACEVLRRRSPDQTERRDPYGRLQRHFSGGKRQHGAVQYGVVGPAGIIPRDHPRNRLSCSFRAQLGTGRLVSSDGFPLGSRDPAPVCRMAAPLYRSFSGALRGFLGVVRANARFSENFILPRRPPPDRPGT